MKYTTRYQLLAFVLFLLAYDEAISCSCFELPVDTQFNCSDAVFVGRVVATMKTRVPRERRSETEPPMFIDLVDHTFVIRATWKPAASDTIIVRTETSSSCGFKFDRGIDYLVYASFRDDGHYWSKTCSRSRPLADAVFDRYWLGPPEYLDETYHIDRGSISELFAFAMGGNRRTDWMAREGLAFLYDTEDSIPPWVEKMISSGNTIDILTALNIYQQMGKRARPQLALIQKAFSDARDTVRYAVLGTIATIVQDDELSPYVIKDLGDKSPLIQMGAANLVPRTSDYLNDAEKAEILDILIRIGLQHPDSEDIWFTLRELGAKASEVLPRLEALSRDCPSESIRPKAKMAAEGIRMAIQRSSKD